MARGRAALRFEEAGGQRLPLGGRHGYIGVRGKQGRKKDKFQGTTPQKRHRTKHYDTPLEAAVAFAQLREDLDLGIHAERSAKKAQQRASTDTSKKADVGVYLGRLCCSSSGPMSCACGVRRCRSSRRPHWWRAVWRWRTPKCWRRWRALSRTCTCLPRALWRLACT